MAGEDAIFTTLATGDGTINYRGSSKIILSAATRNTLMITNVVAADAGTYFVEIRNGVSSQRFQQL